MRPFHSALAVTTLCVGAMVIARALPDSKLSTELRGAALRVPFEFYCATEDEAVAWILVVK